MIIAGSGHRPDKLGGYDPKIAQRIKELAINELQKYLSPGILKKDEELIVISGMALGWDTALALAALELKIKLHCYIPFIGQESKWPSDSRILYKMILKQAALIKCCSPGEYTVAKMHVRNKEMVDSCDLLLVLFDGTSGGTSACIKYAMTCNTKIVNVWPKFNR